MHWQRVKNCRDMLSSRSPWLIATLFGVVWAGAAVIFYWRFPNNLAYPNFYAEDGSILARNILEHGFWHALMITFNGYYIWGLYLLEGGGFALNTLLFGAQLVDLPKAFAIMSYTFLGLIAASPIIFTPLHERGLEASGGVSHHLGSTAHVRLCYRWHHWQS